ncbi:NDMA-dependent alcohol dehydrogenase [Cryptosporangium aurantiacum]|uniref:S-(Hydroxymethyl)glutathione dehydrogenase / alcohol dehydrogenase n=1 Tax=Cryptosporangium aurantiacum TaxID=134849 RepID=A0A1M7R505_9ACTN|nr:NDMA-dependent alcohol dehydrogenase [Cryptosporangium aurantiacum]SHN40152.1 S-(hydroxymethyl)glutathione dehydrogenase / alcohol dehydrogenase [Cryptosporangium aurantiacum]
MKVDAAVLYGVGEPYKIEEIELDAPREREVLVELTASGLCHSDDHLVTGDVPLPGPMVAGHEGAGVVVDVGSQVTRVKQGDHVILHPVPSCGQCRWCVTGRANLCDLGAFALTGYAPDGTYRRHLKGEDIGAFCQLGTFSPYTTVSETQVVAIDADVPLEVAALIGCGVTTGVGAATKVGRVQPGDVVVVIGVGGVGTSAVQGARIAGASTIVAVEPGEYRRRRAAEFGATHSAASVEDATGLVRDLTHGVMADVVLITVGVMHGELLGQALALTSKGGRCVITSVAPLAETTAAVSLFDFAMSNKRLLGHVYGEANPQDDFRRLVDLYRSGALRLDEMITQEFTLAQINEGFAAMHAGTTVRGAIRYR